MFYSKECDNCGSKEHATNDCPHGFLDSKCDNCGSKNHKTSDCPHGFLDSKCNRCGSLDHRTSDCPQDFLDKGCNYCGSKEHKTSDCPHGFLDSSCQYCGSVNHKTTSCPQKYAADSADSDAFNLYFWAIKWMIVIGVVVAALYIAAIIAAIALLLSPIILLIWYLISKRNLKWQPVVGILVASYFAWDFCSRGPITDLLKALGGEIPFQMVGVGYAVLLALLSALYLDKISFSKFPKNESGNFITSKEPVKRRPFIAGISLIIILLFLGLSYSNFSGSSTSSQAFPINNTSIYKTNGLTGQVTGSNVVIRKEASTNSKKIGSFKNPGEKVAILDTYIDNSNNSSILKQDFDLGDYILKRGKAVRINSYSGNQVNIIYQNANNKNRNAVVPINLLEDTNNQKWYNIKRINGEQGWVFGKFISVESGVNKNSIAQLLLSEDNREINKILSLYAANINRYWNKRKLNKNSLSDQYKLAWRNSSQSNNEIIRIIELRNNYFELETRFSYRNKNGKNITNNSKVIYHFDNNGFIDEVYGIPNNRELAVISDSDGYTNLRSGRGTNFTVVKRIHTNDLFFVKRSPNSWWEVETFSGAKGYIYHNRVDLINRTFYVVCVGTADTETEALKQVNSLEKKGYEANHLWIPNYASLSGAKKYLIYLGPQNTQTECEKITENYRTIDPNAYGLLVSQEEKRVEIRGVEKVKIFDFN